MAKTPGLSLADIGRLHEDVRVGEGENDFLRVYGVSSEDILSLLQRFPEILVKALQGGGLEFKDLIKVAPHAVSAVIAAAVGKLGDAETEASAKRVPVELQFDILEAVGRLTFKSGFGPFAKRVLDLVDQAGLGNSGKASDTKSPLASNTSSPTATQNETLGS